MSKSTSTRLGQILLDKGLVTAEQLDIAIREQQNRRQLLDPFDANLGVNSSLGEILIELGFIDRLQLRRGLNWQLMVRKMAIVMSFCAPLMTVSYGAAAATTARPTFTTTASSSSTAPKVTPGFTKTSSSASSTPAILVVDNSGQKSSSSISSSVQPAPVSSAVASSSSRASSIKSSSSISSKASSIASSVKSSVAPDSFSGLDTTAPRMPDKITVTAALYDRVQLSWNDAIDEAGVTHYKIYRDQVQIDTIDAYQTQYTDFNVAPGKTYLYGISAGDDAGNWSVIKSVFAQTAATPTNTGTQTSSTATSANSSSKSSVVSSTSSKASVVSSSSSSKALSSVASSSSSSKAASSVASTSSSAVSSSASSLSGVSVAGPVSFNWVAPTLRENGNSLDITEIGGYELRYRKVADTDFTYVSISDAWQNNYSFSWLEGRFLFQVAAFDKNGNYSDFVDIAPH